MAQHLDAVKRNKQNEKRRLRNRHYRATMRSQLKKVRAAVEGGDVEKATAELNKAVSIIQRLTTKNILHRRTAARKVSRLYKAVNGLRAA